MNKLFVQYRSPVTPTTPLLPRRYTLTHSDETAQLFLVIGPTYAEDTITSMRDEVKMEWRNTANGPILYGTVLVSNESFSPETAAIRYQVFLKELPLALSAIYEGDRFFFNAHPSLKNTTVYIHFQSNLPRYEMTKNYGPISQYTSPH
ncbi:hypothetical protein A374_19085 [Fictibacillus macauensis ZFHKF-1]|uniref:Staygreen protein domain-containing protein n=1 Tax=Fictibacillus macauensis ZFHKF-1 TaxID=1196324 RepID=I8U9M5_9BACL|nr:staygreen family protein [Fictibacillus macauensis]EIT83655.1 hypothetical protein A374_19085 [Fictibacillus macauensis ZFHKF-1]